MPEGDLPSKELGSAQLDREVENDWLLLDSNTAKFEDENPDEKVIDLTEGQYKLSQAAAEQEKIQRRKHSRRGSFAIGAAIGSLFHPQSKQKTKMSKNNENIMDTDKFIKKTKFNFFTNRVKGMLFAKKEKENPLL